MTHAPTNYNAEEEEEEEEEDRGGQQDKPEAHVGLLGSNEVEGLAELDQSLGGEELDQIEEEEESHPLKKKRVYPSDSKPKEGYIDGVSCGDHPVDMARKQGLEPLPKTQRSASRLFNDTSREILTWCEDLANRSASWIYIAMHHPAATLPFTHFASRRIRKEAPEELAKIHQEVSSIMRLLKRTDRTHSLDNERETEEACRMAAEATKAQEASQQAQEASERAARAELETERLRRELAARNKVISDLYGPSAQVDNNAASTSQPASLIPE
ncbi:hypothetical protein EST38_g12387 [Candolleomyces aberdarensis]|uniref:Uncharacterized protein n=1 Tax=Candolleomyces aberdarensis TaxID=2316362 RepID=A0A4Q2D2I5_9AGAR|nr:hypothetical protein EST38_g12387 [Candolleomyces aberdarensis]